MTDTRSTRESRPDTDEQWRALQFYHQPDQEERVWQLVGSESGLRNLVRMLASQADKAAAESKPGALAVGPYDDFFIRIWERPGIDDESIHGSADDLRRLSQIIKQKLDEASVGDEITIGQEYARNLEYTLALSIRDDDFDPAAQVPEVAHTPAHVDVIDVRHDDPHPIDSLPSLPCKFHDSDAFVTETDGLIRLEHDRVVIEFQTKDAFFGLVKADVEEVGIPLEDISAVDFKRGWFITEIAIQGRNMRAMDGLPAVKQARVRLRFKRKLRDEAERLATEIEKAC